MIKDFDGHEYDIIEIDSHGFGASNLHDFHYDSHSGALSFEGTQFATIENPSNGFELSHDLKLV